MKYVKSKYTVWEDFSVKVIVQGFDVDGDFYHLHRNGTLDVKKGYPWDGPTGAISTPDFVKASCIHDILCEMVNELKVPSWVQSLADEQMRIVEKKEGMPALRRFWTYFAVRMYQVTKRTRPKRKILQTKT
jgi:hypothetical protein